MDAPTMQMNQLLQNEDWTEICNGNRTQVQE